MIRRAFLLSTLCTWLSAAQPVAMVVDLGGRVTWDRVAAVHITDAVEAERALTLEPGARMGIVFLKNGVEQAFTGPARITFKADATVEGGRAVSTRKLQALQGKLQLKPSPLAQASVVMKEMVFEEAIRAPSLSDWPRLTPKGPSLQDPSPEFTWSTLPGAKFTFLITDDQQHTVLEATVTEPRLKLPLPSRLRGGKSYHWLLRAELPDASQRHDSGSFRLLDEAERADLQAAKPGPEAGFSDRLLYASLLDQLGVKDEAKSCWRALALERPNDPNLRRLSAD